MTKLPFLYSEEQNYTALIANFSKQAIFYEQAAHVQKYAAQRLDNLITEHTAIHNDGNIIDIGCGTGVLSKYLIQRFPSRNIYFIDPAAGMLQICKQNMINTTTHHLKQDTYFIESSIENYLADAHFRNLKYTLIASSFTLHWLRNFKHVIHELLNRLEVNGQFVFCFPIDGSFPEWQAICAELNLPFTANTFPSPDDLLSLIDSTKFTINFQEYSYPRQFSSALHFFQEIKMMGANSPSPINSNYLAQSNKLGRLIKAWDKRCHPKAENKYNQRLICTYRIIEGIITRYK